MLKSKQFTILSLLAVSLLSACSKKNDPADNQPDTSPKTSVIVSGVKIMGINGHKDSIPTYWVDGVEKQLPNFKITRGRGYDLSAIALSETGKIHFFANGAREDRTNLSQYWIDGVEQTLPPALAASGTYSRAVVNNEKLYIVGYSYALHRYTFWIDGIEQPLFGDQLFDITVAPDGLYTFGVGTDKDGAAMILMGGAPAKLVRAGWRADRVLFYDGTFHVVGQGRDDNGSFVLSYWAYGEKLNLRNSGYIDNYAYRPAMAIADGKVYIIGLAKNAINGRPVYNYWIDGIQQPLPQGATKLTDITVLNGKVYLLGEISGQPAYWIDGVVHNLPAGIAYAGRILVKKNKG